MSVTHKDPMVSVVGAMPLEEPNSIIVEGHWENYQGSFRKELLDAYKKGSESWDDIINYLSQHILSAREGANKRGNSSRLTQSFHFFMFEPIFSPVNALNQPI